VIQVIINKTGNNWKAFPILFVLTALGTLAVWLGVNMPKGKDAAVQWAAEKRRVIVCSEVSEEKDSESAESNSEGKSEEI
jgi:hypothetical protein